ncbi:MAG: Mobile element protein [Candidatus Carbobacillus altaicus]|uniref:Mobile element protein n=1 Tax=Candidatus Carbonibacillus altaicus TaxID=2163959 RepID=A0A2R6XZT5_9BACL|nr:MAG: Mobile element protein [Candidatus Carbobacillus altaicus]
MKITFDGHAFRMTVTISHLSEPTGVDALDRPIMSRAPRVLGRLWIPAKYQARLLAALHQLESKLHGHNGLARPQQESFFSCWRELKTLALAFR